MALDQELISDQTRVIVNAVYNQTVSLASSTGDRSHTRGTAKSLPETFDLVRKAIQDYESRANLPAVNKIVFTEEEPDVDSRMETITFSLIKRAPGSVAQGAPFEGKVRNLRPILIEDIPDTENPGYRKATYGYWHDNLVNFTCWARTNKAANARADWFEQLIEEYMWWLKDSGVDRFLFQERVADVTLDINGNKWYGRPLMYYVRTETLYVYKEKTIEEIIINLGVTG